MSRRSSSPPIHRESLDDDLVPLSPRTARRRRPAVLPALRGRQRPHLPGLVRAGARRARALPGPAAGPGRTPGRAAVPPHARGRRGAGGRHRAAVRPAVRPVRSQHGRENRFRARPHLAGPARPDARAAVRVREPGPARALRRPRPAPPRRSGAGRGVAPHGRHAGGHPR